MILSKSQLVNNINTEISDQSTGQISPYDIRHNMLDVIDSVHNLLLNHNQLTLDKFTTPSIFIEILMFFSRIYILGFKIYMKFRDKF